MVVECGRVVEIHGGNCRKVRCVCERPRVVSRVLWEQLGRPATLEEYEEARRSGLGQDKGQPSNEDTGVYLPGLAV